MSTYVTLTAAKTHIGNAAIDDDLLQGCLDAAEAFILMYLDDPTPLTGTPTLISLPLLRRAILEQCAEFVRFRGDDPEGQGAPKPERDGEPSPFVKRLLYGVRRTPIP